MMMMMMQHVTMDSGLNSHSGSSDYDSKRLPHRRRLERQGLFLSPIPPPFWCRILLLILSFILFHHETFITTTTKFPPPSLLVLAFHVPTLPAWSTLSTLARGTTTTTAPSRRTLLHGWFTAPTIQQRRRRNNNSNNNNVMTSPPAAAAATTNSRLKRRPNDRKSSPPLIIIDEVNECIGTGSYGTVHYITVTVTTTEMNDDTPTPQQVVLIGKRPWTLEELQETYQEQFADNVVNQDERQFLKEKAVRCQYYYQVEQHCVSKLMNAIDDDNDDDDDDKINWVPPYVGTGRDDQDREWLLWEPLYAPPPPLDNLNRQMNGMEAAIVEMEPSTTPTMLEDDLLLNGNSRIALPSLKEEDDLYDDDNMELLAFSLQEIMEVDRINWEQQQQLQDVINSSSDSTASISSGSNKNVGMNRHHLYCTSQALLGLDQDHTLVATLDVIMDQLLQILVFIHSHSIVHRDVKPANLLITKPNDSTSSSATSRLVLIDFGSAGDLSTSGLLNQNIGLDLNRVAISPIYAAPEIYLDQSGGTKYATNFDCFSVALLFCQLLFQYLDERTESGFHQQMANQNVPWDLDSWLQSAIQSKVRPVGLAEALQVLSERPGLWKLLQEMLNPNPTERLSSTDALRRWNTIRANALKKGTPFVTDENSGTIDREGIDPDLVDSPYLLDVLESLETCEIPTIRPLHFVTSFDRSTSLGLYLAEADGVDITSMDETIQEQWQRATADAGSGEVFVQDITPGGQADQMGVFAIGDRLQGVGELPLAGGGFERATELIQDQPKSAEFVTLQFDRKSVLVTDIPTDTDTASVAVIDSPIIKKVDQGAWSVKGRRQVQEDAFILHEVLDTKDKSVILAGVFDGHLGSAASDFCRDDLPVAFAAAMNVGTSDDIDNKNSDSNNFDSEGSTAFSPSTVQAFLELAWNECCESYRSMCEITDAECIAEYDPKEGILQAKTGSQTAVAGTTAMVFAFDQLSNQLATLNCGDSRGIVLNANHELVFQTTDHRPDVELERLTESGNPPKCDIARWTIAVNNYDYSVARSLEGNLATSKGIISDADVTLLTAQSGMTILAATDGLWDTIDTAEVMRVVAQLRPIKSSASDIAKALCSLAYEKGSSDNISVVVLCLE